MEGGGGGGLQLAAELGRASGEEILAGAGTSGVQARPARRLRSRQESPPAIARDPSCARGAERLPATCVARLACARQSGTPEAWRYRPRLGFLLVLNRSRTVLRGPPGAELVTG